MSDPAPPARRRPRRLRWVLVALLVVLLLPVAVAAVLIARFDPAAWRPQIIAAVDRATGRDLALDGPIGLAPSLWPTITVQNATLTGQGETVSVARMEAQLALLPLLSRRVEVDRLLLVRPRIEWGTAPGALAAPRPPRPAAPATRTASSASEPPLDLFVRTLRIEDGTILRPGVPIITLTRLDAHATDPASPIALSAALVADGVPVEIDGTLGSLPWMRAVAPLPWQVQMAVRVPGAQGKLDFMYAVPTRGIQLSLSGTVAEATSLRALLPGSPVPVLRDAAFDGRLQGDQIDVTVTEAGARFTARGKLGPGGIVGLDLVLSARIPDLAALQPGVLPALKDVAFDGRLTLAGGMALRDVRLTAPQGDLSGEIRLLPGARRHLQATLVSKRIDLDALLAAMPARARAPASQHTAPPPPGAAPGPARLIPDTKLPFAVLRRLDADLSLRVAELVAGGAVSRDLAGTLKLADGQLALDPVGGQLPEGRLDGTLHIDAARSNPPVALVLHAPGLAIQPLLAALGLPGDDAGALEIDADLRGAGDTPRAIAAGLDGHLGVAMVDGAIDNRLLEDLAGPLLRSAKLPADLAGGRPGRSTVRCLALRVDAAAGIASLRTLLLDMSALRLEASGIINLRDEALDLHAKPLLRMSGSGMMVPLRIGGTLLAPRAQADTQAAAGEAIGAAEGALGKRNAFAAILGALTSVPAGNEVCAPQLALARGGREGAQPKDPPPPAAGAAAPSRKPPKPADLLRDLLR